MIVVLYTRRNVGLIALSYLVALGYSVKVITDDGNVKWMAERFGCPIVQLGTMGEFDLFLCVHGDKFVDTRYFNDKPAINIHPSLFKYKGHNPIKKYIKNKDTIGSVESHYMTSVIDDGEVIHQEFFDTPVINDYAEYYNVALPYYFKCLDKTLEKIND